MSFKFDSDSSSCGLLGKLFYKTAKKLHFSNYKKTISGQKDIKTGYYRRTNGLRKDRITLKDLNIY